METDKNTGTGSNSELIRRYALGFTKFLKRLFCRHTIVFIRNLYGDEIIEYGYKRSLWRCTKCGHVVAKDELCGARDNQLTGYLGRNFDWKYVNTER